MRADKLDILIIQPWIKLGGAELISINLARQLAMRGHDAQIACVFSDMAGMASLSGDIRICSPPVWLSKLCARWRILFFLLGPWLLFILVWKLSRNKDILNPHNFPSSWIACAVGAIRGIPVVWTCNEPPEKLNIRESLEVGMADFLGWLLASSWIDRWLARFISAIYVPSERTRSQVAARYKRDAEVIGLGIDIDFFDAPISADAKEGLGLVGAFVLTSVGKLHPQKNQIISIRALALVANRIPEAILLLVGDGPSLKSLQATARGLNVDNRVIFMGHMSRDDLIKIYQAADLNLFPAINQSWGLVPFEALAVGLGSVASNECGAAEIITKERIGIVCEPDENAFAEKILSVYSMPDTITEMALRGRAFVRQNLTWDRYCEQVVRLFQEACRATPGVPELPRGMHRRVH